MQLLINADDFGRSREINRAVIRAHREGVLDSASLMIAGKAAAEAVELAKQNPALAVGLHVVAVDGPAVLPAERIPHLVNRKGEFPNSPATLGFKYAFSRTARRELSAELEAQFERFAQTGLPLAHVDGHQHLHMHPFVFDRITELAQEYGARRIRIVHDDLRLALRYDRTKFVSKALVTLIFALLRRRCRIAAQPPMRTYGFLQSGRMTEQYVSLVLQQMHEPAEIYFHPTDGERLDELGPNPGDLMTLTSPEIRRRIWACRLLSQSADKTMFTRLDPEAESGFSPAGGVPVSIDPGIGSVSLK